MSYSLLGKRVWIAGHNGMVGRALEKKLSRLDCEILTISSKDLDLTNQADTRDWIEKNKPQAIFIAAAKVGGIWANNIYPSSFLYDNLMIEANIIEASARAKVEKLILLGTGCIYPREASLPVKESALLTAPLEETNQWYAIAKIAGIKLCQAYKKEFGCNFISAMPTNLYGPFDNFNLETSHVLPALMHKIHLAKKKNLDKVTIWGSGKPLRELMHVDDCADALVHIMEQYDELEQINIGTSMDMTIESIAQLIAEILDWDGEFVYDRSKPDGTMRKLLDTTKLNALNWRPKILLRDGIKMVYDWFLENEEKITSLKKVGLS